MEDGTDLKQGITQVLMAPGKGIQSMAEVLAFVFIIGGVFQIMAKTNALNMGIQKIVKKLGFKRNSDHSHFDDTVWIRGKYLWYVRRVGSFLSIDHADYVCHGL